MANVCCTGPYRFTSKALNLSTCIRINLWLAGDGEGSVTTRVLGSLPKCSVFCLPNMGQGLRVCIANSFAVDDDIGNYILRTNLENSLRYAPYSIHENLIYINQRSSSWAYKISNVLNIY